jgi:hypothetical protein
MLYIYTYLLIHNIYSNKFILLIRILLKIKLQVRFIDNSKSLNRTAFLYSRRVRIKES